MIEITATCIRKDDGAKSEISVSISDPYWTSEGAEASCDVKISPLYEDLSPIVGINPLHALKLAMEFSEILIEEASEDYDFIYH